jgi:hypothetical protein
LNYTMWAGKATAAQVQFMSYSLQTNTSPWDVTEDPGLCAQLINLSAHFYTFHNTFSLPSAAWFSSMPFCLSLINYLHS